jgi:peptidoglycan hydrolase-like protein with peptidoglycan-binding domain
MRRALLIVGVAMLVAAGCSGEAAETGETAETTAPTAAPDGTSTTRPDETTTSTSTASDTSAGSTEPLPAFLVEGDRGSYVAALQFLLDCAGYGPVTVDGVFGPRTAQAVRLAQGAEGKRITGEPDEATFALLARACGERRVLYLVSDGQFDASGNTILEIAGNVADGDPDTFDLAIDGGRSISVEVVMRAPVDVSVEGPDGTVLHPPGETTFTVEIPVTEVYTIRVSGVGPASYQLFLKIPPRPPDEPFDPSEWIGIEYSGDHPEGLEFVRGQCVGVDLSCDYAFTLTVRPEAVGLSGIISGPVDYLGLLERSLGNAWRIVDAETVRVDGDEIVSATCFTNEGNVETVGIWDYPERILHAFAWNVEDEQLSLIPGDAVTCLDPADNE